MKIVICVAFLLPLLSCSQSKYDAKQDIKINKSVVDITTINASIAAINTTITRLGLDAIASNKRITELEQSVKSLQDSVAMYRAYLSSDFFVDKNKTIYIPKLPVIEARLTKLEAKP